MMTNSIRYSLIIVLGLLDLLLISSLFAPIHSSTNLLRAAHKAYIEKSSSNQKALEDERSKVFFLETVIRLALVAAIIGNSMLILKLLEIPQVNPTER